MPKINPLTTVKDFLENAEGEGKYICHCYDMEKVPLKLATTQAADSIVMVGPEGDFSLDEVELAQAKGFTGVALGKERLRTETAGVVACHTVNLMNQE